MTETSIELKFLSYLFKKENYKTVIENNITEELFIEKKEEAHNINAILFDIFIQYYKVYYDIITSEALQITLDSLNVPINIKTDAIVTYNLIKSIQSEEPFDFIINTLKNKYKEYKIKNFLQNAVNLYNNNKVESIIDNMNSTLSKIVTVTTTNNKEQLLEENIDSRILSYTSHDTAKGVLTSFKTLDDSTNGLFPGQLVIFAAGTGEGKSVMLLNIAYNAWRNGSNVVFFTIENYKEDLLRRVDSLHSGIPYYKLRKGLAGKEDISILQRSAKEIIEIAKKNKFYIVDKSEECTPEFISAKLVSIKDFKIDLVVVDYLHIMNLNLKTKIERDQYYGNIALELRRIAKNIKVPIVTAVQVNREGLNQKKGQYDTQHIALSQFISNHADLIISLKNKNIDQTYLSGVSDLEASIVKHRDGPKRKFNLRANFEIMKMQEIEQNLNSIVNNVIPNVDITATEDIPF